jgi:nicotinate-nucleotide adenylyltransferase
MKDYQIALFGTSADPPTIGHQAILAWLSSHYDHVGVWASDNPFKNHQTVLAHRNQMLRLLVRDLNQFHSNLSFHKELSHLRSFITVQKATQLWGDNVKFTLVIGSDLIEQIHRWYRISELLQRVILLIIIRPGYNIEETSLNLLTELGATYQIADFSIPNVSSSNYRQKKKPSFLPISVAKYIEKYQLYQ